MDEKYIDCLYELLELISEDTCYEPKYSASVRWAIYELQSRGDVEAP